MNKENQYTGLNDQEVLDRHARGEVNQALPPMTRSFTRIFLDNSLTLFNFINLIIAGFIIYTGSYKNLLFLSVILVNTIIGIYQEIRAKRNIDRLTFLNQAKVNVIRNSQTIEVNQDEVVKDDLILLKRGQQIVVDGEVISTEGIECDESQLTGETDPVEKQVGSKVFSGSFIISGSAIIRATDVGQDSYTSKLTLEAKQSKSVYSELVHTLKGIIRVLTFGIIPVGSLLFISSIFNSVPIDQAILGATAAMIGMIPEGLILLTTVALAVGVIRLTQKKVLVKTMGSIETLARIDLLCLDKTGTITTGNLKVVKTEVVKDLSDQEFADLIGHIVHDMNEDNATGAALMAHFPRRQENQGVERVIPFSSERKWSAIEYQENQSYVIGAPDYMFKELDEGSQALLSKAGQTGLRILAVAQGSSSLEGRELPSDLTLLGFIFLEDEVRPEAHQTLEYFKSQGVDICIISGDHIDTVSQIAQRVGVAELEQSIDMSQITAEDDYQELVKNYRVFGRVSPEQKRKLVSAFQSAGRTVGMTGDGVNDILALKKADCSIVMANGSDAVKGIADFVLLDSNFDSMVGVVLEGRKVVNNIQRVASLYLNKTVYSIILAVIFIFLNHAYPFQPIQLSPISGLTVGIPSFFLALRPNTAPIKGRFFKNVLEPALASGLSVVIYAMVILFVGNSLGWTYQETSTITVLLTGLVSFTALYYVSEPINWQIVAMIVVLITLFVATFLFFGKLFSLVSLFQWHLAIVYLPLIITVIPLFYGLKKVTKKILGNF